MSISLGAVDCLASADLLPTIRSKAILDCSKQRATDGPFKARTTSDPPAPSLTSDSNNNWEEEEDGEIKALSVGERRYGEGRTGERGERIDLEQRNATDDSLESGPLDDTLAGDEDEVEDRSQTEKGILPPKTFPLNTGATEGGGTAEQSLSFKRLLRSSSSPAAVPNAREERPRTDGVDAASPTSRKSSPRHFSMSGEVRDLRSSEFFFHR